MMLPPLPFLIAAFFLAIAPGPGIAYVMARTLAGGKKEGIASSLGAACGGLVHVVVGALGLSVLVTRSPLLYSGIKYLGAAYLIYLGVRTLLARAHAAPVLTLPRSGARKAFRDGVVVETLNIKTGMFFLAFIPQFVSSEQAFAPQFIELGAICVLFNTLVDLLVVAAVTQFVSRQQGSQRRARILSLTSGVVMLALGAFVVLHV